MGGPFLFPTVQIGTYASFVCGSLVVLVIAILWLSGYTITYTQSSNWERLNELEGFESVQENKITEIRLRNSISSANWAVFSDKDLIQKWLLFFNDVEIKEADDLEQKSVEKDGGGWAIDVKSETGEVSLIFKTVSGITKVEFDGNLYDIRGVDEIPLEETYNIAIERHGVQLPWD